MTAQDVITLLRTATTPDQIREANQAASTLMRTATATDATAIREAKARALSTLLDAHEVEQQETLRFLALNGKRYNLEDWLTPVEYARRYGLRSANNVTNWMMRGIIPPDDILDVPELNGLRLVRNRVYKSTTTPLNP